MLGCGNSTSSSSSISHATKSVPTTPAGWRTSSTAGVGSLERVSCPADGNCWATGENDHIFHFSSGRWSQFPSPVASSIYGISCPLTTDCWAVGAIVPSGSQNAVTFIEHFNGRKWSRVPSPNEPGFPESGLSAISCPTTTDCWAAGGGDDQNQQPRPGNLLLLHFTDGKWSLAHAPSPQQEVQKEAFIQCQSTTRCVLVSTFGIEEEHSDAAAGDVLDGHGWSSLSVPSGVLIQAMSCLAVNDCYAVGGPSFSGPMSSYHFNGTTWAPGAQLPSTLQGAPVAWSGLSCSTARDCWAVGGAPISTTDASGPVVVARFESGAWTLASTPHLLGDLKDISCRSATACWAVGGTPTSNDSVSPGPLALQLGS
jgi:hypothetical protein